MREVHDLVEDFDTAMVRFREALADTRRHWAATTLATYPGDLQGAVDSLRDRFQCDAVEINAIYRNSQIPVATSPVGYASELPLRDTLCALTVGAGEPLAIQDIKHDPITQLHSARSAWGSWGSVPLMLDGQAAGTICVLQHAARIWTHEEQGELERMAELVSLKVEAWVEEGAKLA